MKPIPWFLLTALTATLALAGCGETPKDKPHAIVPPAKPAAKAPAEAEDEEAEIKANLAKLSPEDRKLAEAQRFCAVEEENRLGGSMGVPIKVMLKEQPVFLCCKGCVKEAQKDPDKTLAKVQELKARAAGSTSK